jgi:phospholipase/carboxylesterase
MVLALVLAIGGTIDPASAQEVPLPQRETPRPQTTPGVPHVQIGVRSFPDLDAELLRRVATLPGVDVRPTVISLPGAKGFWLNEHVPFAHPEVIVGGRELAHVHPDGSLHAALEPGRARSAAAAG